MDEDLRTLANQTVEAIYRVIREVYSTEFSKFGMNIGIGADGTPTKYIDKIAEDAAVEFIKNSGIAVNVLSEESGFMDFNGEYVFVLDPIDGTRNASRGIPLYAISLGVGRTHLSDVSYGIVKNIPTGDVFLAEKNHGAFYNNQPVGVPDLPGKSLLSSVALGKNADRKTLSLSKKGIVRSLGSASLEMCLVAIGALDYYVVGKDYLRVTDIAASTLIVREAGGFVKHISGEELELPLSLDERTSIIAVCSEELLQDIIS